MTSRSDATTLPSRSIRRLGRAWLTHPLTLGIGFGYVLLTLWSEYSTKWAAYVCIGVFAAIAGPLCARAAGGMDRFLFLLFIFCLQFSLSFNVTYFARDIPGGVQGLNVSLMTLLAACYVVTWMVNRYLGRTDRWHFQWSFVVACAVFWLTSALSFLTTPDHTLTLYGLVGNLSMVIIGIVTAHMCSTRERIKTAAQVLLIVLITQSIICLIERATNTTFTMQGEAVDSKWGSRVGGTMGIAPANVATLIMVCLFFAERRLFFLTKEGTRLASLAFAVGIVALLLSLTRSAWIGFGVGSAILVLFALRRRTLSIPKVALMGACMLAAIVVAWGPVHDRLGDNHQAAADERFRLNYIGYEMISARPVLGVGLNTIYSQRRDYLPSFFTEDDWIYIPHNQFIVVTAETGFVGLLGFIWILITGLRCAYRGMRSQDPFLRDTGTVLFVAILSMCWGMNLDFYAGMQVYAVLWLTLGFAAGVAYAAETDARNASKSPEVVSGRAFAAAS